jgi:S1-C subfamily serine protease
MKHMIGAAFLFSVVVGPASFAQASVPLPIVEQAVGTPSLAPILKKVTPAVVKIAVKTHPAPEASAQRKEVRRAETTTADQSHAAGSGVVLDARQGLIVTNNHVIEHADEITVSLSDGRELPAKLIGGDPDTDIAVVKVAADNLTSLPIGDSRKLEVGDFVLAIGNPFQIGQTASAGIISGLHRNNIGLEEYENFIQTDAAIYPGDSGGALVNLDGQLIGINTAFVGAPNTNSGMGFAIPIDMVRTVVDRIVETGDLRRGKVGITFEDPTPSLVREFKLPISAAETTPVITKVEAGSPADRAGVKAGDVVTELGSKPVLNTNNLRLRLGLMWVGDIAQFTVKRDGKLQVLRVAIADIEPHAKAK